MLVAAGATGPYGSSDFALARYDSSGGKLVAAGYAGDVDFGRPCPPTPNAGSRRPSSKPRPTDAERCRRERPQGHS